MFSGTSNTPPASSSTRSLTQARHFTELKSPYLLWSIWWLRYSDIGDTVYDPFMGAGATGVACMKLDRWFIGGEMNEGYYNTAHDRIRKEFYARYKNSNPMTRAFELVKKGKNEKPYR